MKRGLLLACVLCFLLCMPAAAKNPVEDYEFPDDWSHDALIFAVENGIYYGDTSGDLLPQSNITRAEMAAVLVRLLGAEEQAELSTYRDVPADGWYVSELSAAVAAGIFSGTSATTMEPEAPITREQAAAVICRAFGIVSDDRSAYSAFSDAKSVSTYARDAISVLYQRGILHGYTDGSFHPAAYITRAEVAQILYKLLDCIADTPEELPASGLVLYRGSEALPDELTLDGTLILGQKAPAVFSAAGWKLTGALVVRTGAETNVDARGLTASELVCAPVGGSITGDAQTVWLWGAGSSYFGDAECLTAVGGTQNATGTYSTVNVRGGSLTLDGDIDAITLDTSTLTLNGTANTALIDGRNVVLCGSGHVKAITVNDDGAKVSVSYDSMTDNWEIRYQREHDRALGVVQTARIPCTVLQDTAIYKNRDLTGYIRTLPKGTVVYNEYHPGNVMHITCADGTWGWIAGWTCSITGSNMTNGSLDYSKATKEGFVDLNGYSSDTSYLIWVSRYTQKVMVFQGKKGNWELIRTFPCSTGSNDTPTPVGTFKITSRDPLWCFDSYYVNNASIFNGGHAFHTVTYNYGGSLLDGRVGIPLSHGCVRMLPADCSYIYNLPYNTCVVIY